MAICVLIGTSMPVHRFFRVGITWLASLACAALPVEALAYQIYRCTMADGNKVYGDTVIKGRPCERIEIGPASRPVVRPRPERPVGIEQAKSIVSERTLDPEAARFRDVRRGRVGSVCGRINAKNAMGGYTGYTEFVVDSGRHAYIHDPSGGYSIENLYYKYCDK